jgi:hypothetical protein
MHGSTYPPPWRYTSTFGASLFPSQCACVPLGRVKESGVILWEVQYWW